MKYAALILVAALSVAATVPVDTGPTVVDYVLPIQKELPANLLKFYVYFSRPVRQTDRIFEQMHILDEQGKEVYDPWRRFHQWSEDGKRLTLWIHPGRIKQGVNLREEFGPVLKPGGKYKLVIDAEVEDLPGNPLGKRFEKEFTATAEDHTRIDPRKWEIIAPPRGQRDHVSVKFDKPLDSVLAGRLITLRDAAGQPVAGKGFACGSNGWVFTPEERWGDQAYTLHIDELLEDFAGNTPVRVFDTDMTKPDDAPKVLTLTFTPKEKGSAPTAKP